MTRKTLNSNDNYSKFTGEIVSMHLKDKCAVETVDFQIKVKRNMKHEIYDYIDCSIYREEAISLLKLAKVGDTVEVTGEFRSSKQEIEKEIITGKFSHFLAKKVHRI